MQDKIITCRDCGAEFTFTTGEQEFYAQKGFNNEPTRCPSCRSARKAARGGGSDSAGAPRQDRNQDRKMYPATCSQCHKPTMVPFEPRDGRPVYCSDCYSAQRNNSGGGFERRSFSDYGDRDRGQDRGRGRGERGGDRGRDRWSGGRERYSDRDDRW